MQIRNPYLDRVISDENFEELVLALTGKQLSVAALAMEGLSQAAIAELLGVDRRNVYGRLAGAARRARDRVPDIAPEQNGYRGRGIPTVARWRNDDGGPGAFDKE